MKILGILISFPLLVSIAFGEGEANTIFFRANNFYKEGKYEEAIREYEKLLSTGLESGNLYYNLGNAYFKSGEKGRAILNYERSVRLLPRDADVKSNLTYAKSLVEGNPGVIQKAWFLQKLLVLHNLLNLNELTLLTFILYIGTMCLAIISIPLKKIRRNLSYLTAALIFFFLLSSLSLAFKIHEIDFQKWGVMMAEETEAKFEPSEEATVYYELYEGTLVRVMKEKEGWCQVRRPDGRGGWVKSESLELI